MTMPTTESPATSRSYWTHGVDEYPGPVAQFRMSQLVDYDQRLTEPARTTYRFLIGWYMQTRGDALASVRHIVETMQKRAPEGARHLSRSSVQRALDLLIKTGWLSRTHTGNRAGASRYVPVMNVLDLATQGTLPATENLYVPLHRDTTDLEVMSHSTGTEVSHSTGTQTADASHFTGTKTLLHDPGTNPGTSNSNDVAGAAAADGLAPTARAGFEKVWLAYGNLGSKAAARAEFAKLIDPDVDHIADRAASWAASARPGQKRMPLEKWLAAEKYDEADRRVEPKPERTAKPTTPKAANSNRPANIKGGVTSMPKGEHLVEVIGYADGNPWAAQSAVKLSLRAEGAANPFVHETYFAHPDDVEEDAGRRSLRTLVSATGGSSDNDNNPNPVGCWVWAVVSDVVTYRAALAPTSAERAAMEGAPS